MADNAQMSFEISNEDMETLKYAEKIKNYGDFSMFLYSAERWRQTESAHRKIFRIKSKEVSVMRKQIRCIAMCMAVIFSLAGCGSNTTGGSDMSDSHYSVSNEDNKTELKLLQPNRPQAMSKQIQQCKLIQR